MARQWRPFGATPQSARMPFPGWSPAHQGLVMQGGQRNSTWCRKTPALARKSNGKGEDSSHAGCEKEKGERFCRVGRSYRRDRDNDKEKKKESVTGKFLWKSKPSLTCHPNIAFIRAPASLETCGSHAPLGPGSSMVMTEPCLAPETLWAPGLSL